MTGGEWVTTKWTSELEGHHVVTTRSDGRTCDLDGDLGRVDIQMMIIHLPL